MTEHNLISLWITARWHIIVSQLAPTFLLAVTVWLLANGLASTDVSTKLAAAGVLLASGLLGAAAQIAAASEGAAIIDDLAALGSTSRLATRIIASRPWVAVVRFVAPAIFVLVYVAILWQLFLSGS
ncbi:MAG: putative integral emmbrane protein [Glaciihabitans sp.]|nr:putative integral emmbrane protein [Glaciihabitans sp.]